MYVPPTEEETKFCKKKQETKKERAIQIVLRVRAQNASEQCDPMHRVRVYLDGPRA